MVLFKSLTKSIDDFLKRDFVHEKPWQVEVKHGGDATAFTQKASVTDTGNLAASSTIRHGFTWGFVEGAFGSSSASAMASYKFKFVPNLVMGARIEHKHEAVKGVKDTADMSVEYNKEDLFFGKKNSLSFGAPHVKFSVDPFISKWSASATSGIGLGSESLVFFGAEANGHTNMKSINYSAGLALSQITHGKTVIASVMGHPLNGKAFGKLVGSVHCKNITPNSTEIGAEITHLIGQKQTADVAIVGQWHIKHSDIEKEHALLKIKLTPDAKLAVAFTQKVSPNLTATLGGQVDSFKFDDVKWGVALNLLA